MTENHPQIQCSACGAPIRLEDIHIEMGVATCSHCHAVMDLALREVATRAAREHRDPAPLPEKFNVERAGHTISVDWRWFSAKYVFLAFFCVAWDSFLIFWYATALSSGNLIMIVFPIAHVAIGVGITYTTLAGFLNRTRVEATAARLRIQHFPLPWIGNREIATDAIEQLFTREKISNGKNGQTITYEVHAILRPDSRRQKLLGGLDDVGQALWLEQTFETHLQIADEPVAGEVARGA